jgi:hypothetical protein
MENIRLGLDVDARQVESEEVPGGMKRARQPRYKYDLIWKIKINAALL